MEGRCIMSGYLLPIILFLCLIMGFTLSGLLGYLIGLRNKSNGVSPVTVNFNVPVSIEEIVGMVVDENSNEDEDTDDWTNRFTGDKGE